MEPLWVIILASQHNFMLRNIFSMLWKVWILSHPNSYKSQRQDNMSFNCYMHLHWNASLKQWYSLTSMFHFFAIALLMQLSCDLNGMKQNSKQFCLQLYSQVACKHKAHFFVLSFIKISKEKTVKKPSTNHFWKSASSLAKAYLTLYLGQSQTWWHTSQIHHYSL